MSPATTSSNTPAPRPTPAAPRSYRFPRFERARLANGLRLLVAPVSKLPVVTVLAIVDAGAEAEPAGKGGIASLTARLLLEGTAEMDGAALVDRFERIGASVDAHADWDVAAVTLTVLSAQLTEALPIVRDLLRAPIFPEREVARLKEERLAALLQQRAEPRGLADEQFARAVYAPTARYADPEGGDETSIRGLTRQHVQDFHSTRYQPGSTTLIFAGDVTMKQARAIVETLFGDWAGPTPHREPMAIDVPQSHRLVRVVAKNDAPQSELRIGHIGVPRRSEDYFDIVVMNAVLGGLFSSRINLNLREVHGYTYGAFSGYEWRRGRGPFMISTAVKSEVTADAVKEILLEIDRIRETKIRDDELTLATSYLDGVFPIRYETTTAIAAALANLVIHDMSDDYYDLYRERVRSVTADGVLKAARTHLHPDRLRVVIVGNAPLIAGPVGDATGQLAEVISVDDEAAA